MSPSPISRARGASRALVAALIATLSVAGALALAVPVPAAVGGTAPWFGPNIRVTALPAYTGYQPSIAVDSAGVLYLAYGGWGGSTTQADVYFTKSSNGGWTWSAPYRVNNDAGGATQAEPSIYLDHNAYLYIVWTDFRNGAADAYFSKSTDGGLSFSANVRVNDVTAQSQSAPDIAVDGQGLIHVVWTDTRNLFSTGPDIYYANSSDGGLSFNPSQKVNNDAVGAEQGEPAIAVASDRSVYAVWTDPRNGARGADIYFSRSTNLGGAWAPNFYINDDATNRAQSAPDIAIDASGVIYAVWMDSRDPNTGPDIYATRSSNGGLTFAANARVNDDAGAIFQGNPSLAANAGRVHAAWSDERTRGSTWRDIYSASSPDGVTWGANLLVNDDGIPFNLQDTPTIGVDGTGNAYAAWFDSRTSGQDAYTAALDVVAPIANAGPDRVVDQDVDLLFDGSATTDNLGIASYAWDFGDGTAGSGISATHAYPTPGTYTAVLTVTDHSGNEGTSSLTVTVRDTMAPTARGAGDRTVDEGQPLFFDATASSDNVGVASYIWNFGDNTTSAQPAVTHVYSAPGSYSASLTVTDAEGNSQTVLFTVTVRAVSPKTGELLGMIQTLDWIVAILAVGLAIVGLLAFTMWRKQQKPQEATPPGMHQMPPPPPPPPSP